MIDFFKRVFRSSQIKVGSVYEKVGNRWFEENIGKIVIVTEVSPKEIKYRYISPDDDDHEEGDGWTLKAFLGSFKLVEDV